LKSIKVGDNNLIDYSYDDNGLTIKRSYGNQHNVNNINDSEEIWSLISQLKRFINDGYPKQIIKQNYFDINRRLNEFDDYLSKVEKNKIDNELIEIKNYINSEV
jgi:hypothetical protein